jgi:hypothetical protein
MVMKVIVINGYPQTGKDTFCEMASDFYNCITYSTVDTVKEIATIMGWDGTKTPENRAMLSELKDFTTKWFDMTFKEMVDIIETEMAFKSKSICLNSRTSLCADFIFLHIREPKEICRIKKWCDEKGVECLFMCIQRDGTEGKQSNHADSDVNKIDYDIYVENNGTVFDLRNKAEEVLSLLL